VRLGRVDRPLERKHRGMSGRTAARQIRISSSSSTGHNLPVAMRPEDAEAVRLFGKWKHRDRRSTAATENPPSPQDLYGELMKAVFAPALRVAGLCGSNGRFEPPSEVNWAQLGSKVRLQQRG
jgi:hypothetical protein